MADAVAQWLALADDPGLAPDIVVDALMRAGMELDTAGYAGEAQAIYRRAAAVWQQLGPRSSAVSRLPEQVHSRAGYNHRSV